MTNQSGLERADDFARSDIIESDEMHSTYKHDKGQKADLDYAEAGATLKNLDSMKT